MNMFPWSDPRSQMGISHMRDKIATSVVNNEHDGNDALTFIFDDGTYCMFYHSQDCCESVSIEDINGDLQDLVGTPILVAEERDWTPDDYEPDESDYADVQEWTFYTFRTIKGSVDVRWYGTSNGYYSTRVDMQWGEV